MTFQDERPKERFIPNPKARLGEQFREVMRFKHYALRTEQAYWSWIRQYIFFHHKRHPRELGTAEIQAFLTHLAVERKVSSSTQNQALNALVFLYQEVLGITLGDFGAFARAKPSHHLPVVLTRDEVQRLLAALGGTYQLMGRLLYGVRGGLAAGSQRGGAAGGD